MMSFRTGEAERNLLLAGGVTAASDSRFLCASALRNDIIRRGRMI
jgi:hypothetical protein